METLRKDLNPDQAAPAENGGRSGSGEARDRVLLIFIDGLGIGSHDPEVNPMARFQAGILNYFLGEPPDLPRGGLPLRSDPAMGVPGIPQSATGQAALFTGINTAESVGRHLSGFPTAALKKIVAEFSILKRVKQAGKAVSFANTYTGAYLNKLYPGKTDYPADSPPGDSGFAGPGKKSVTTVMSETAGLPFRTETDLVGKKGLHMDFSNRFLRSMGYDVPLRTPEEAAEILVRFSSGYDLCLYEFFFSDLVGHRGNREEAVNLLKELDAFLFEIVSLMDFENSSLIVTSDHGNVEDMSTRRHTENMVPLLVWGKMGEAFRRMPDPVPINGIAPVIYRYLNTAT